MRTGLGAQRGEVDTVEVGLCEEERLLVLLGVQNLVAERCEIDVGGLSARGDDHAQSCGTRMLVHAAVPWGTCCRLEP